MTADSLAEQQPTPQEVRSPNLPEQMEQLFDQIATLFEETPRIEMDYYYKAYFESWADKGKGWLDKVGREPPVHSLEELLSLLRRAQNWHQMKTITVPRQW